MYKINKFEGEIYQKLNKILDSYNQEQNSLINLAACISYPFTEVLEIQSFPLATLPTEGAVEKRFFPHCTSLDNIEIYSEELCLQLFDLNPGDYRVNVQLVTQYLVTTEFNDDTVQAIMDEALKFEGWKYVYGGASPTTSFDCSGLTQWTYGKAGINLPRTAQQQYDVTRHIPLLEAKAGDLVFFHSTYNAGSYITHIGIYLGDNRMFHAGDPIGYADLTSSYWQQHLVGAGRIKQ